MSELPVLFGAATLLAACLASIAVWAPRRLATKLLALGAAALLLPVAYLGFSGLLGRPKPAKLEWWLGHAGEATVLASVTEEGRRILLWLRPDGSDEPRAYELPWDRDMAQQLQQAQQAAAADQTGVRMRMPLEPSLDDGEPRFYATPQPAMPPKEELAPPAATFVRPGEDA